MTNPGKGIAGHGDGAKRPPVQVAINKTVTFTGVQIQVANTEDGGRLLQIIDPATGTLYNFPLEAEAARTIGNALFSAVPIIGANEMPGGKAA